MVAVRSRLSNVMNMSKTHIHIFNSMHYHSDFLFFIPFSYFFFSFTFLLHISNHERNYSQIYYARNAVLFTFFLQPNTTLLDVMALKLLCYAVNWIFHVIQWVAIKSYEFITECGLKIWKKSRKVRTHVIRWIFP